MALSLCEHRYMDTPNVRSTIDNWMEFDTNILTSDGFARTTKDSTSIDYISNTDCQAKSICKDCSIVMSLFFCCDGRTLFSLEDKSIMLFDTKTEEKSTIPCDVMSSNGRFIKASAIPIGSHHFLLSLLFAESVIVLALTSQKIECETSAPILDSDMVSLMPSSLEMWNDTKAQTVWIVCNGLGNELNYFSYMNEDFLGIEAQMQHIQQLQQYQYQYKENDENTTGSSVVSYSSGSIVSQGRIGASVLNPHTCWISALSRNVNLPRYFSDIMDVYERNINNHNQNPTMMGTGAGNVETLVGNNYIPFCVTGDFDGNIAIWESKPPTSKYDSDGDLIVNYGPVIYQLFSPAAFKRFSSGGSINNITIDYSTFFPSISSSFPLIWCCDSSGFVFGCRYDGRNKMLVKLHTLHMQGFERICDIYVSSTIACYSHDEDDPGVPLPTSHRPMLTGGTIHSSPDFRHSMFASSSTLITAVPMDNDYQHNTQLASAAFSIASHTNEPSYYEQQPQQQFNSSAIMYAGDSDEMKVIQEIQSNEGSEKYDMDEQPRAYSQFPQQQQYSMISSVAQKKRVDMSTLFDGYSIRILNSNGIMGLIQLHKSSFGVVSPISPYDITQHVKMITDINNIPRDIAQNQFIRNPISAKICAFFPLLNIVAIAGNNFIISLWVLDVVSGIHQQCFEIHQVTDISEITSLSTHEKVICNQKIYKKGDKIDDKNNNKYFRGKGQMVVVGYLYVGYRNGRMDEYLITNTAVLKASPSTKNKYMLLKSMGKKQRLMDANQSYNTLKYFRPSSCNVNLTTIVQNNSIHKPKKDTENTAIASVSSRIDTGLSSKIKTPGEVQKRIASSSSSSSSSSMTRNSGQHNSQTGIAALPTQRKASVQSVTTRTSAFPGSACSTTKRSQSSGKQLIPPHTQQVSVLDIVDPPTSASNRKGSAASSPGKRRLQHLNKTIGASSSSSSSTGDDNASVGSVKSTDTPTSRTAATTTKASKPFYNDNASFANSTSTAGSSSTVTGTDGTYSTCADKVALDKRRINQWRCELNHFTSFSPLQLTDIQICPPTSYVETNEDTVPKEVATPEVHIIMCHALQYIVVYDRMTMHPVVKVQLNDNSLLGLSVVKALDLNQLSATHECLSDACEHIWERRRKLKKGNISSGWYGGNLNTFSSSSSDGTGNVQLIDDMPNEKDHSGMNDIVLALIGEETVKLVECSGDGQTKILQEESLAIQTIKGTFDNKDPTLSIPRRSQLASSFHQHGVAKCPVSIFSATIWQVESYITGSSFDDEDGINDTSRGDDVGVSGRTGQKKQGGKSNGGQQRPVDNEETSVSSKSSSSYASRKRIEHEQSVAKIHLKELKRQQEEEEMKRHRLLLSNYVGLYVTDNGDVYSLAVGTSKQQYVMNIFDVSEGIVGIEAEGEGVNSYASYGASYVNNPNNSHNQPSHSILFDQGNCNGHISLDHTIQGVECFRDGLSSPLVIIWTLHTIYILRLSIELSAQQHQEYQQQYDHSSSIISKSILMDGHNEALKSFISNAIDTSAYFGHENTVGDIPATTSDQHHTNLENISPLYEVKVVRFVQYSFVRTEALPPLPPPTNSNHFNENNFSIPQINTTFAESGAHHPTAKANSFTVGIGGKFNPNNIRNKSKIVHVSPMKHPQIGGVDDYNDISWTNKTASDGISTDPIIQGLGISMAASSVAVSDNQYPTNGVNHQSRPIVSNIMTHKVTAVLSDGTIHILQY